MTETFKIRPVTIDSNTNFIRSALSGKKQKKDYSGLERYGIREEELVYDEPKKIEVVNYKVEVDPNDDIEVKDVFEHGEELENLVREKVGRIVKKSRILEMRKHDIVKSRNALMERYGNVISEEKKVDDLLRLIARKKRELAHDIEALRQKEISKKEVEEKIKEIKAVVDMAKNVDLARFQDLGKSSALKRDKVIKKISQSERLAIDKPVVDQVHVNQAVVNDDSFEINGVEMNLDIDYAVPKEDRGIFSKKSDDGEGMVQDFIDNDMSKFKDYIEKIAKARIEEEYDRLLRERGIHYPFE